MPASAYRYGPGASSSDWQVNNFCDYGAHARIPRILALRTPHGKRETTSGREPGMEIGEGGRLVAKEHRAKPRDQPIVALLRLGRRLDIGDLKVDAVIGPSKTARKLNQRPRNVVSVNDASCRRPA